MFEYILAIFFQHPFLYGYILVVNFFSFILFGVDKSFSFSNARRIRERTLLLVALIGGSAGALAGVFFFRHKTRKNIFLAPLIFITLVHIALVWWFVIPASSPLDQLQNI